MSRTYVFDEKNGSGSLVVSAENMPDAKKELRRLAKDASAWRFDHSEAE